LATPVLRRLGLFWNRCSPDQWPELFAVDLDGPHFKGLDGVFVVWHGGAAPKPIAVGFGRIADELKALREDPVVVKSKSLSVLATWARVDAASAEGVVRFLNESLKPMNGVTPTIEQPIEINLPGYPPLEGAALASPGPEASPPTNQWKDMMADERGADELDTHEVRVLEEAKKKPAPAPAAPAKAPPKVKKVTRLGKLFEDLMAERMKAAPKSGGLFGGSSPAPKAPGEDDGLVAAVVRLILQEAMNVDASDIHLEPLETLVRVRFRIDGLLEEVLEIPHALKLRIVSNIRVSCGLDPEKGIGTSKPEDARMSTNVGGQDIDLRLSTFPTPNGDKAVLRVIPRKTTVPRLVEIGLRPEVVTKLVELVRMPQGMIIVTGPTGSGKSTTLYTLLSEINEPHRNIVTLEDPIEKRIPGISQGMLQPKVGFTFAEGLRAILRQDPNVIMVGEVRDIETAEIAMRASLTGHMVLTTLHTNSAIGAITRLLDMGLEPFLICSALTAVFAQRLGRRVCAECAVSVAPTPEEKSALEEISKRRGLPLDLSKAKLVSGRGCTTCRGTGYKGRVLLFEMARMSPGLRQMILKKSSLDVMYAQFVADGGETLFMDGWLKVAAGLTTIAELLRVAGATD